MSAQQLSFLEPVPFSPAWPCKNTLEAKALEFFLEGRKLNHPVFDAETGSWRLAAVVFTLRNMGWPIETKDAPAPSANAPGRTVAIYHLDAQYIAQAKALAVMQ